ncbi:hypothetical protein [Thermanaeromonas sp. C210]|uniref:hypothetical protein n=1 Tax=Thermanaeromonas sp. C210 TaxID=2731925 RepID=UPI00155D30C1|nr:hypothetical protein [Thermanaeromonas sp. C210]GFN23508.1 hypothetical protein TAMC210_18250 [Thermanaeromonas sp. C210]
MDDLSQLLGILGAIFAAAQGIVEQLKGRWPWLGQKLDDPVLEKRRQLRVLLANAIVSALLAGIAAVDVFGLLGLGAAFAGIKTSYPGLYLLLNMIAVGLMSTFGSPFLHEILDILIEFKRSIRIRNQVSEFSSSQTPSEKVQTRGN